MCIFGEAVNYHEDDILAFEDGIPSIKSIAMSIHTCAVFGVAAIGLLGGGAPPCYVDR